MHLHAEDGGGLLTGVLDPDEQYLNFCPTERLPPVKMVPLESTQESDTMHLKGRSVDITSVYDKMCRPPHCFCTLIMYLCTFFNNYVLTCQVQVTRICMLSQ